MKQTNHVSALKVAGKLCLACTSCADKDDFIVLNETGEFIWNLLSENISEEDIVNKICAEYLIERTEAETDVNHFLNILSEKGLLVK